MKAIKIALTAMIISAVVCSCKKKDSDRGDATSGKKLDTLESFTAEYKKCHAKGVKDIIGLIYKKDQVPENVLKLMEESEKAFIELKIKSVTTEPFDATDFDKGVKAMETMNMKMPAKPTHNIKIVYDDKDGSAESTMPIAKIDGSFHLIAPHKTK